MGDREISDEDAHSRLGLKNCNRKARNAERRFAADAPEDSGKKPSAVRVRKARTAERGARSGRLAPAMSTDASGREDEPFAGDDPFADKSKCEAAVGEPQLEVGEAEGSEGCGSSPPDLIEVGGERDPLVLVRDVAKEGKSESDEPRASRRPEAGKKSRRQIRIMESPAALAATTDSSDLTLSKSKPTKYYKPPKATSPAAKQGSPSSYSTYAGSSSPATLRGLVRGVQRLFSTGEEDLSFHRDDYSATGESPDFRMAQEQSRGAARRAGRRKDLYTEENKEDWRIQCQVSARSRTRSPIPSASLLTLPHSPAKRKPFFRPPPPAHTQMRAQERDVAYVADMRVVYRSRANDNAGDPIVVAVGAHYSKRMIPREDMLLHILNLLRGREVGGKPFTLIYCHANAELETKPKVGWFKSLVAAMGEHWWLGRVKRVFVVHPTPLLRTWLLSFQIRISKELFGSGRVTYVRSLRELQTHLVSENLVGDLPDHVVDQDGGRAQ